MALVQALYLADSVETMWAEWYRHLAERDISQFPPSSSDPGIIAAWKKLVAARQALNGDNEQQK